MSEIQDEGQALLTRLRGFNLALSQEKLRLQGTFEQRVDGVVREREVVQRRIQRLRPLVEAELATEQDEVQYVLALHRRDQLDRQYHELRESVAQLNLVDETVTLEETVELDGAQAQVDT